jgi:hypothetical protein
LDLYYGPKTICEVFPFQELDMPITVSIRKDFNEERHVVSAHVQVGQNDYDVWYQVTGGPLGNGAETFLAALLLPAMKVGGPLRLPGEISPRLLHALPTIQDIFRTWCPDLQKVVVESQPKVPAKRQTDGAVASFFSGGVDSFYTLLKHRDEITHLIFVHGFDILLEDKALRETVAKVVRNVASEFKKQLIEIETNIHVISDPHLSWEFYHGPALASSALLLAPQFKKIYIPSSHSYSQLFPWGSHPIVDPLWSTEELEIVHDGCEASRVQKVLQVASSDVALRTLRVCWENRYGAYNCGECDKCLRTMVSLQIAGALDRCATFDRSLDLTVLARLCLPDENSRGFMQENLVVLSARNSDEQLVQALRDCLEGRYHKGRRQRIHQSIDRMLDVIHPKRIREASRRAFEKLSFLKN